MKLEKGTKTIIIPTMLKGEKYSVENFGTYIIIDLLETNPTKRKVTENRLKADDWKIFN